MVSATEPEEGPPAIRRAATAPAIQGGEAEATTSGATTVITPPAPKVTVPLRWPTHLSQRLLSLSACRVAETLAARDSALFRAIHPGELLPP